MKRTKPGKAARVDEVCPELLRADMKGTASRLTSCYNRLWETEKCPKVWKKAPCCLRYSRKEICANATTGEE